MTLELRLSRPDKTYRVGEMVSGIVMYTGDAPLSHNGLKLRASGVVRPQLDPRTVGIFEALYSSIKPIEVLATVIDMQVRGQRLPVASPRPLNPSPPPRYSLRPAASRRKAAPARGSAV